MRWTDYLSPDGIFLDLSREHKDLVINEMVHKAYNLKLIPIEPEKAVKALMAREQLISTGIGHGIALPHAKVEKLPSFISLLGILKKGIDWDAVDEKPVHLIAMILGPKEQPTLYIKLLARVAKILDLPGTGNHLLHAGSPEAIYTYLQELDDRLEQKK